MGQRRDFLRENILHLREIQRVSRDKEVIKKQEKINRSMKIANGVRTSSFMSQQQQRPATTTQRINSALKANQSCKIRNESKGYGGDRMSMSISQHQTRIRTASSRIGHKSTAVQTDDIDDDIYLLNALKKNVLCGKYLKSTTETHVVQKMLQEVQESYSNAVQIYYTNEQIKRKFLQRKSCTNSSDEEELQFMSTKRPIQTLRDMHNQERDRVLATAANATVSTSSLNALSPVDNDTFSSDPYLGVNGKTNKDEDMIIISEMEHDPYCPFGYVVLSESERLKALQAARSQFKALMAELNQMQSLRQTPHLVARRTEIDKEVAEVEANIRIFSKPKVYVKREDMPLRS